MDLLPREVVELIVYAPWVYAGMLSLPWFGRRYLGRSEFWKSKFGYSCTIMQKNNEDNENHTQPIPCDWRLRREIVLNKDQWIVRKWVPNGVPHCESWPAISRFDTIYASYQWMIDGELCNRTGPCECNLMVFNGVVIVIEKYDERNLLNDVISDVEFVISNDVVVDTVRHSVTDSNNITYRVSVNNTGYVIYDRYTIHCISITAGSWNNVTEFSADNNCDAAKKIAAVDVTKMVLPKSHSGFLSADIAYFRALK